MESQWFNILLVEDETADATVIRRLLADARGGCFEVELVGDLAAALARISGGGIDAVLLDLHLPDSTGLDTFRVLYRHAPTIPIVVLSGLEDESLTLRAVQLGAQDYLVKGEVDTNVLERSLRYAMERQRGSERQRRSEAELRLLVQQLPALLWTTDKSLRFTSFRGAALPDGDGPSQEMVGQTLFEVFETSDPDSPPVAMHRRAARGESVTYDMTWHDRTYHVHVEPLSDARGRSVGCIGVAMDITERIRAEDALRHSEARFRRMFESNVIGAVFGTLEGGITDANDAFLNMLGYGRADMPLHWDTVTPARWRELDERALKLLRTTEVAPPWEKECLTKDGRTLPVLVGVALLDCDSGECVYFALDLTARKAAEEEVQRLNADLEKRVQQRTQELTALNQELEAYNYSVSHDLRSPLRAIDGFSLMLLEEYGDQLEDRARTYFHRIRNGAQRMGQLIDAMLALSRITRGQLQQEATDLSETAESIATELRRDEPQRNAEFVIQPGLVVNGDPMLLRTVLENLLRNAWKFTAQHRTTRIEFGSQQHGGQTTYYVRDDGAGFDQAYADKLFGSFERLHPPGEFDGLGLGLATVQRIIQRHGGRVWATGAVEEGATFFFTLSSDDVQGIAPSSSSSLDKDGLPEGSPTRHVKREVSHE